MKLGERIKDLSKHYRGVSLDEVFADLEVLEEHYTKCHKPCTCYSHEEKKDCFLYNFIKHRLEQGYYRL